VTEEYSAEFDAIAATTLVMVEMHDLRDRLLALQGAIPAPTADQPNVATILFETAARCSAYSPVGAASGQMY